MGNKARSTLELYSSATDPTTPTLVAGAAYYNTTAKALRIYDGAAWVDFVNDETAQTVAGIKTFSTYAIFPAATTSIPSIRMPHGTAPSAPTNGDVWTTTTGVYARINGATQEMVDTVTTQTITGAKTFSTRVIGPAATTSISSFRAPHGTAPAGPVDGDIWTTTAGMYVRINGATVGPLSAGGGVSYATTSELANVDNAAENAGASALVARGDHKHAVNSATAIALTGSAGAGTSTSLALADHQHGVSGLVLTTTNQTIAGNKTFSNGVTVSPGGGPFYCGDYQTTAGAMVWEDGIGTTFASIAATAISTLKNSYLYFSTEYWSGAVTNSATERTFGLEQTATSVAANRFYASTSLAAAGSIVSTLASGTYQAGINASTTSTDQALFVYSDGSGYVFQVDNRGRLMYFDGDNMTTKGLIPIGGTGGARNLTVGADGTVLTANSIHARGASWVTNLTPIIFTVNGQLGVASGVARVGVEGNYTIQGVRARVDTAPTGTSIKVDIHKNGTTLWSTQANRPDIAVSTNASSYVTNMNTTTLAAGDYLTMDVDVIGSTIAGSHLTVTVWMMRTA